MDDFWELYVFKLNTGSHYLIPVSRGGEQTAWEYLAERLSRSMERTKRDCKLIHIMNGVIYGMNEIIKL